MLPVDTDVEYTRAIREEIVACTLLLSVLYDEGDDRTVAIVAGVFAECQMTAQPGEIHLLVDERILGACDTVDLDLIAANLTNFLTVHLELDFRVSLYRTEQI